MRSITRSKCALFFLSIMALAGCDEFGSDDPADDDTSVSDTDGGNTDGNTTTGNTTDQAGWRVTWHPCLGNRTDAQWVEDGGQTVWVGCGTTTTGYGLFLSEDGGVTWSEPTTSPVGFLENFRVDTISRSADGQLYVGGINTLGSERVVSLDTTAQPYPLAEVFTSTGVLWDSFQAGTFRRASTGFAVAESLTGFDLAYRTADDQPWQDGYGWWGGGASFQLLDMDLHNDQFYGCGSTIGAPPMAFLPPQGAANGFSLVPVQLATGLAEFDGEMWGMDADDDGLVIGGVNQDRNVGMVFTGPLDGYDSSDWTAFDLSTLYPGDTTWIRGACRHAGKVVAVGEFSSKGEGIILLSTDSGASFTEVTPTNAGTVPPVHRCQIFDDGSFVVSGADGFFGRYTP